MSAQLQDRAKRFTKLPVPKSPDYVPGSMAERFIATYASDGKLQPDDETRELLEMIVVEAEDMVSQKTGVDQAYFRESAEILRAMLGEMA